MCDGAHLFVIHGSYANSCKTNHPGSLVATWKHHGGKHLQLRLQEKLRWKSLVEKIAYAFKMAASMKSLDPSLRKYLRSNKLPDVYEACIFLPSFSQFINLPYSYSLFRLCFERCFPVLSYNLSRTIFEKSYLAYFVHLSFLNVSFLFWISQMKLNRCLLGGLYESHSQAKKDQASQNVFLHLFKQNSRYLFLLIWWCHTIKILHSLLKCVIITGLFMTISNFPFNKAMKAMAMKGIWFGHVLKCYFFIIRTFDKC